MSTSECQRVASGKGSQLASQCVGRIGEERGSRETRIRCVVGLWNCPACGALKAGADLGIFQESSRVF